MEGQKPKPDLIPAEIAKKRTAKMKRKRKMAANKKKRKCAAVDEAAAVEEAGEGNDGSGPSTLPRPDSSAAR